MSKLHCAVASLGDRPGWHPPGWAWHPKEKIAGEFTMNSGRTRSGR